MAEPVSRLPGTLQAKAPVSRCLKGQGSSDAPGAQNQLIHKLCDLPRIRLPGPGQSTSRSSLQWTLEVKEGTESTSLLL